MYRSDPIAPHPSSAQGGFQPEPSQQQAAVKLTRKETEVLQWSAAGKSSWEISQIVNCSEAGVNYHFSNIRRKFGVSSRWTAAFKALELGLIDKPYVHANSEKTS
ncbi:LuxR family transcriptional regulator, quorum-sensing transcription factor LasR [Pseudomonas sp. NFACC15-1]|uniref:helix-turn-helix transcriptional regulator n=1 Tax=unclassified Pseudomonas TaxID=196821 RepID=UPI000887C242|nr:MULTISPECIES: helix-turn-helix domain-containing protein [unclassified Pseudomonas]SCZ10431.1 LuxR family transcriptional regulator, quorum-sensing transcription factor LasR [Pseudomonas sp. NFACC37-1]SDA87213.1 LuxR family transcriptional regulator, quorum-sensing transcription factor LasR [Pseudomonas sp. NFACC15-1]SDY78646.1 LuxR family transcriptional regulator, quorum-sensing transcription factor LasR [Pseudomonas sp. NFACC14]SFO97605.1 LuxR family transcriptional regulator, quorum-sens